MSSPVTLITIILLAIPAIVLARAHCTIGASSSGWTADYSKLIYTSVASIYQTTPSTVCPTINPATVPLSDPSDYLEIAGPLGYMGPLSPEGPLGMLGPIGNNTWNPSTWMFTTADWSDWSEQMTALGGPLSASGPLGPNGPVSPSQYYGQNYPGNSLFESNDFAVQLRAFGLWSALGPIGPLGALGPLGPLGPIGAHGYSDDSDGNYLSQGQVVRTVSVPYDDGTQHTFELYENYQEAFAKTMTNQDTSFMVEGTSLELMETDYYPITSAVDQIVTIVLVPVYTLTAYSLGIYDDQGKLIGTAETTGYIETMQLTVPAGTSLTIAVKYVESMILIPAEYRLYVTGSTEYLNQYNIQGDQVLHWYDNSLGTGDFDSTLSDSDSDSDSS